MLYNAHVTYLLSELHILQRLIQSMTVHHDIWAQNLQMNMWRQVLITSEYFKKESEVGLSQKKPTQVTLIVCLLSKIYVIFLRMASLTEISTHLRTELKFSSDVINQIFHSFLPFSSE